MYVCLVSAWTSGRSIHHASVLSECVFSWALKYKVAIFSKTALMTLQKFVANPE